MSLHRAAHRPDEIVAVRHSYYLKSSHGIPKEVGRVEALCAGTETEHDGPGFVRVVEFDAQSHTSLTARRMPREIRQHPARRIKHALGCAPVPQDGYDRLARLPELSC